MIRRHRRTRNYTNIDNKLINDTSIDWRDLGLLVYLISKHDDWEVSVTQLANERKSGRDAIRASLKRLQETGYATWQRKSDGTVDWLITDEKNQFETVDTQADTENPDEGINPETANPVEGQNPETDNPDVAESSLNRNFPNTENPTQQSNEYIKQNTDHHRNAEWLANYLARKIRDFNPDARLKPDGWVKDIEKMLRIDGREPRTVLAVVNWIHSPEGSFWQPNILSGRKLREKYDHINGQRIRSVNNGEDQSNRQQGGSGNAFWDEMQRRHQQRESQQPDTTPRIRH